MLRRLAPLLVLLAASSTFAGEIVIGRVFGPEIATGPYKHPACIEELGNGDLYLVYYGGEGEYAAGTAVFGARRERQRSAWSTPQPIARDPLRPLGNAVVWRAPDGVVWLFYVVRDGETWSTSRIQFKTSRDDARSWSDASVLSLEPGTMVRNRPIVLDDGAYLLPAYKETGADPELVGPESSSIVFRHEPKAHTWTEGGRIKSSRGNIQPAIVQLPDRSLLAFCRRGGGYRPDEVGYIVRSTSLDGGRTWSAGVDSPFPNPNAAVDLIRLRSGSLLLVYNPSMNSRTPLTIILSEDEGKTWPHRRNVVEGPGDFAYPSAIQARDGSVHLVFTSHGRTVVNHAVFDENWVRSPGVKHD